MARKVIGSSAAKSCDLDPAPTFLIKEFLDPLLPFLTRLCNVSLQEGRLPSSQTTAIVTPALKKPGMDPSDMKNYHPISNLSFSQRSWRGLLSGSSRSTLQPTASFLNFNQDLEGTTPQSQLYSGCTRICSRQPRGERCRFSLSDVSAAFDTVNHSILLDRLSISYGVAGSAFAWMRSFIVDRTQTVHYGGQKSQCAKLRSGVAQGSVLGPLLYVLYTAEIQKLVQSLGFNVHLYADDTQFHGSCKSSDAADLAARSMCVISAVKDWMSSNRLGLNTDKPQFIWLLCKQTYRTRAVAAVLSVPSV